MKTMIYLSAVSALAVALATPALAMGQPEVVLKDVAARVVVTPENRTDIELKVDYADNNRLPKIMVHMEGRKLVADGGIDKRHVECRADNSVELPDLGTLSAVDLPLIHIKVPMDADIDAGGATFGQVGASSKLDFSQSGCGDWTLGDVAGKLEINIGGDGDVAAGSAGDLDVNIAGDGDVVVERVNGRTDVNIAGDGDVLVKDGHMSVLDVKIAGDGDVRFGGEAGDVKVKIMGDGDIHVKKVTGKIDRMIIGDGNIVVGE